MWLTRFALSRPTITIAIFGALVIFGIISFVQLGRSSSPPNTDFPVVAVYASYPGASPQDMERMVIKPIEDQLNGMENLDRLTATAQEGTAVVVALFKLDTDLNYETIDVQRRVDTARIYMPSDLNPPFVDKASTASDPILEEALSSKTLSPAQLSDIVNTEIVPELKGVPGILSVDTAGDTDRELHVFPDQRRLLGSNATVEDVYNALVNNNANLPGGRIDAPTSETTVSIHADIIQPEDILRIPLPVPNGAQKLLTIGNVAAVEDGHVEQRRPSTYNGSPSILLDIERQAAADTVQTTVATRAAMVKIAKKYPDIKFSEIDASADYTRSSVNGVLQSLCEGIMLTAIVMLLFLHAWRNAIVVMVAIPASILSTFILMRAFGFHIDTMSMMGLSLIIGILVDDSIVVLENITRHRDLGEEPMNAAINGRTEIGNAAIAITMVDVVVFLPVAFLPGIVGAYLKEFGAVIVIATLFSLFVSFTLTPLLAAKWSVLSRSEATPKWLLALDNFFLNISLLVAAAVSFLVGMLLQVALLKVVGILIVAVLILNLFVHRYDAVLEKYRAKWLPFGLEHGTFVIFTCSLLLVNALALVGGGMNALGIDAVWLVGLVVVYLIAWFMRGRSAGPARGFAALGTYRPLTILTFLMPIALAGLMVALGGVSFDFVPETQTGHINMTVTYPSGTPIAMTDRYVTQLEEAILKIDGVKDVSSTVGRKPSGWGSSTGGNYAQLGADMQDSRRGDTNKAIVKIRNLAYLVPGGELQVAGDSGNGSGAQIFYSLSGPEDEITGAAEKVASVLRSTPGSVNVQTSAENGAPRLNVDVDSGKCAMLGINPSDVATVARIAVDGAVATRVRTSTGLVDVRVQFPNAMRTDEDQLANVRVRTNDGSLVPISSVATFTWTTAPTKIERLNRQRVVNVYGNTLPGASLGAVEGPLEAKLKQTGFLPQGVGLTAQGDTQFMQETFANMGIALILSFMLVYMLMVILYGSFLEPLIVMFSVPMAIIGALIFLALMGRLEPQQGQSLNIISMLGIIMLFGLVAKNGILLVDYSNTLCKRGMRVKDAVLQSASTRFRPIIMTTAAMIFGMLPLALGFAEGGEWRQAIGTVIIGGLLSSLILTLFLVPMIYNTWMGYFERRADRRAVHAEQTAPATV